MEAVYDDPAAEELPSALQQKEDRREGMDMADMSQAWMNCLSPGEAYGQAMAAWEEDTPTRLGRRQSQLRLTRWRDGRLTPWAEGRVQTQEPAHLWELSTVAVGKGRVAGEAPISDSALKRAVDDTRAAWPDRLRERVLLIPLTPGPEGQWQGRALDKDGKEVELKYHPDRGLELQ